MKTDMLVRRNDGTLARAQCAYLTGQEEARIIETVEKRYGIQSFFSLIGMNNKHILYRKWPIAVVALMVSGCLSPIGTQFAQ